MSYECEEHYQSEMQAQAEGEQNQEALDAQGEAEARMQAEDADREERQAQLDWDHRRSHQPDY